MTFKLLSDGTPAKQNPAHVKLHNPIIYQDFAMGAQANVLQCCIILIWPVQLNIEEES